MKKRNTGRLGFTLIELLVVVLIIGILAAVAVPQYQKAVLKARFVQLFTNNDALVKAQKLYYLANNEYASSLEDLDIDIQNTNYVSCSPVYAGDLSLCYLRDNSGKAIAVLQTQYPTERTFCCTYADTSYAADSLCSSFMNNSSWYNGCSDKWPCHCYNRQ